MSDRSWRRLVVVQVLIASMLIALLGRLYYMQIASGPRYQAAAMDNQSRDIVTPAARGMILDDKGVPLAMNRTGLVISLDHEALQKAKDGGKDLLSRLAKILGTSYEALVARTTLCGAKSAVTIGCWNGSPYQPIPLTNSANSDMALQIIEHSEKFPGVTAEPEGFRFYPAVGGANAAHVLGYIGPVSTEEMKSKSARNTGLHQYDLIGKAGLEYQYDTDLRGESGIRQVVVDRTGAITRIVRSTPAIPGNHLVTSIDARLQTVVEQQLAAAIARARAGPPGDRRGPHTADGGAAIVMDVTNGRIIAMASYPTYDPNIWENGLSYKQAKALFSEASAVPALSRAIQGQFAPASTFKVVSLAAAAAAGYDLNATYACPVNLKIGDRVFANFEGERFGRIPMRTAIAVSCDTVWYQIAYDMWVRDGGLRPKKNPADYFFKAAKAYRIGERTGIDLPSEVTGRLADREWRTNWYAANSGSNPLSADPDVDRNRKRELRRRDESESGRCCQLRDRSGRYHHHSAAVDSNLRSSCKWRHAVAPHNRASDSQARRYARSRDQTPKVGTNSDEPKDARLYPGCFARSGNRRNCGLSVLGISDLG
jgi:penicillin-binding protein 2